MPDEPRLGLIIPSTNTTVEREITRLPAASWHSTRVLQIETDDPAEKIRTVLAMQDELGAAVDRLGALEPVAVGFACTAASFLDGAESDLATCAAMTERLGAPFVTASRAVRHALDALGADSLALVTPYIEEVNRREVAYFEQEGIRVVSESGLGIVGNLPKGRLPAEASLEAALAATAGDADVVFVSCTNWLTFPNLDRLQEELGRPVISSNSALAWELLRLAGAEGELPGLGSLASVALPRVGAA